MTKNNIVICLLVIYAIVQLPKIQPTWKTIRGILVFVKKYLSSMICVVQKSEIAITLMLKCGITGENKSILFYFIYIPPIFSSTYDYLEEENGILI